MSRLDPQTWSTTYPHAPGHVRGSPTSEAAAEAIAPKLGNLHRRVWAHMRDCGGCTDEEGQEALGLSPNTYRPRRRELELQGHVERSGITRPTRSGIAAVVWVVRRR